MGKGKERKARGKRGRIGARPDLFLPRHWVAFCLVQAEGHEDTLAPLLKRHHWPGPGHFLGRGVSPPSRS